MTESGMGLEAVDVGAADVITTAGLRAALSARGITHRDIDDVVLAAVLGCAIDVDDVDLCAAALLDLGPMTVIEALENGSRWTGVVERLARLGHSTSRRRGVIEAVPEPFSPDAGEVLRWVHVATGTAFVDMVRSVVPAGTDVDAGIDELVAGGVLRVTYPVRGPASETVGTSVSTTLGHLGLAADEFRRWAMAGGAELLPAMTVAVDTWVLDDLRRAHADPSRLVGHACAMRRHGLVALDRFAAVGRWDEAAETAAILAPALVAAGLHRALHRQVTALLTASATAPADVQRRLRLVSADLHLASGNLDVSRHLLNAASPTPHDETALRWRSELLAAVWAHRVDPAAVLRSVERGVAAGGSHTVAAEVTLDLAARLLHEGRPTDADSAVTAAGAHAAVAGNDLLLARLDVTSSIVRTQIGDCATGRRRLQAAYPIAAAQGQHTFVHLVAGSTGAARHDSVADGTAHLADVVDALVATGAFDLDRNRLLAGYVADHGPGWTTGSHRSPTHPALSAVGAMYPSTTADADVLHVVADPTLEALTTREAQVAELVAGGLSNVDIGDRLGISRWTVVSHLRNIMRKWDCSSRVEVALRYRQ